MRNRSSIRNGRCFTSYTCSPTQNPLQQHRTMAHVRQITYQAIDPASNLLRSHQTRHRNDRGRDSSWSTALHSMKPSPVLVCAGYRSPRRPSQLDPCRHPGQKDGRSEGRSTLLRNKTRPCAVPGQRKNNRAGTVRACPTARSPLHPPRPLLHKSRLLSPEQTQTASDVTSAIDQPTAQLGRTLPAVSQPVGVRGILRGGLVGQSFRSALGAELRSYLGLVATLEGQIRRALAQLDESLPRQGIGKAGVTLRRCVVWTREATMGLRLMSLMVEESRGESRCAVVKSL